MNNFEDYDTLDIEIENNFDFYKDQGYFNLENSNDHLRCFNEEQSYLQTLVV